MVNTPVERRDHGAHRGHNNEYYMNLRDLTRNLIANYERHGWKVQRVLLRSDTTALLPPSDFAVQCKESEIDALWFSRPSHNRREAWELRLISETPYALLVTFDSGDSEASKETAREELETRLKEYVGQK